MRSGRRVGWWTLLLAMGLPPVADAAWQTPRWAVVAEAQAMVGFDSNLYGTTEKTGDGFAVAAPSLRLFRRNSLTFLEMEGGATHTRFFSEAAANSTDWRIQGVFRYPEATATLFTQRAEVGWARVTDLNPDLHRRVREDRARATWEAEVFDTGKTAVGTRVAYRYDDPRYATAYRVDTISAGSDLVWKRNPLVRLGIGYDATADTSSRVETTRLRAQSHAVTLRGRGQFLPKLAGEAFIGGSYIEYSGRMTLDGWRYTAGGDLWWEARPRLSVRARFQQGSGISAEGEAVDRTNGTVELRQEMRRDFALILSAGGSLDRYRGPTGRRDDGFTVGAAVAYTMQKRLHAMCRYDHLSRSSDFRSSYVRDRVVLLGGLRF